MLLHTAETGGAEIGRILVRRVKPVPMREVLALVAFGDAYVDHSIRADAFAARFINKIDELGELPDEAAMKEKTMIITKPMRNEATLAYSYGGDLCGRILHLRSHSVGRVARARWDVWSWKRRSTGMRLKHASLLRGASP
jgi:hypothetical protein